MDFLRPAGREEARARARRPRGDPGRDRAGARRHSGAARPPYGTA